jgi:hypothetical protein
VQRRKEAAEERTGKEAEERGDIHNARGTDG